MTHSALAVADQRAAVERMTENDAAPAVAGTVVPAEERAAATGCWMTVKTAPETVMAAERGRKVVFWVKVYLTDSPSRVAVSQEAEETGFQKGAGAVDETATEPAPAAMGRAAEGGVKVKAGEALSMTRMARLAESAM